MSFWAIILEAPFFIASSIKSWPSTVLPTKATNICPGLINFELVSFSPFYNFIITLLLNFP